MPVQYLMPSDTRAVGTGDPPNDANALIRASNALGAGLNVLNAAFAGGADPTGAADSTAAIQAALNACPAGGQVTLPPGIYKITTALIIPTGVTLTGWTRGFGVPTGGYGIGGLPLQGAIIKPANTFAGASTVIQLASNASTQYGNQSLRSLVIDGSTLPGGTVHGITADAVAGVTLRDVTVTTCTGDGLHCAGVAGTGFHPPVLWDVSHCKFSNCAAYGANLSGMSDCVFEACECTGNGGLAGWAFTNGSNTRFLGCKGENNGQGQGWLFTSASGFTGQVVLSGCTAQLNGKNGFAFTGTGNGEYILSGCRCDTDGQLGGTTYAGINCTSFSGAVFATGVTVRAAATPYYGVSVTSTTYFAAENCIFDGASLPVFNGGSNGTVSFGRAVAYGEPATGISSSPASDPWSATDLGYQAVPFDPVLQIIDGTARLITAGVLTLIGVVVRQPCTVSKVDLDVANAGATLTSGQCLVGLYNLAGTRLGTSGDQSAVWNTLGFKGGSATLTPSSTGSLNLTPGQFWIALLGNGTTMPGFTCAPGQRNSDNRILNGRLGVSTARYGTYGTAQTSMPATITPASIALSQVAAYWAGLY